MAAATEAMKKRSLFFPVMATIMALIAFVGFSRTFYFRSLLDVEGNVGVGPLPGQVIAHGIVFSFWMLLFVGQAWLIQSRHVRLHRSLGYGGLVVAVGVVVVAAITTVKFVPRAMAVPPITVETITGIFVVNFITLITFSIFVGLAIVWRGSPAVHKRLMLFATISILGPALAGGQRPIGAFVSQHAPELGAELSSVTTISLIVAVLVYDYLSESRIRSVTFWAGSAIAAKIVLVKFFLMSNEAVQAAVLSLG